MRVLGRLLSIMLAAGMLVPGWSVPASAAESATTFVTMVGDERSDVARGQSMLWYPDGGGEITVTGTTSGTVDVFLAGGPSERSHSIRFAAPLGQSLDIGTYERADKLTYRSADRAGLSVSGDGRVCPRFEGRFTILDIAPDLSRLWMVYEKGCGRGGSPVFGEIRYAEPGGDTDLLVAPGVVDWPTTYPGASARVVPVTLVNTGTDPVTVSGAVVDGSPDFVVEGNHCSTLAGGEECQIYVGFRPSTPGPRHANLVIDDDTAAGSHSVDLRGRGAEGRTSWSLRSDVGDWVGDGQDYAYSPTNATMWGYGSESSVEFSLDSGHEWWYADFKADPGRLLLPGSTFEVTSSSRSSVDPEHPVLNVSGLGRGCNRATGRFTVDHAAYRGGRLEEFAVRFEQHCEGRPEALRGAIEWRVPDDVELPREAAPARATDVAARPMMGAAQLTWDDPDSATWSGTAVRSIAGATAPATPEEGQLVYHGRDGHALVEGLDPGTDYSFSVFPMNIDGVSGERTGLTLLGTDLTLQAPATVSHGEVVDLRGTLQQSSSGATLAGRTVTLYRREPGVSWQRLASLTTADDGAWAWSDSPERMTRYRVQFGGAGHQLGDVSGPVTVDVAPAVDVAPRRASVKVGRRVVLRTAVAPDMSGRTVVLQHRRHGHWRKVDDRRLATDSTTTFVLRDQRVGTYRYRVIAPGTRLTATGASAPVRVRVAGSS